MGFVGWVAWFALVVIMAAAVGIDSYDVGMLVRWSWQRLLGPGLVGICRWQVVWWLVDHAQGT